jgi:hypothetical protein
MHALKIQYYKETRTTKMYSAQGIREAYKNKECRRLTSKESNCVTSLNSTKHPIMEGHTPLKLKKRLNFAGTESLKMVPLWVDSGLLSVSI